MRGIAQLAADAALALAIFAVGVIEVLFFLGPQANFHVDAWKFAWGPRKNSTSITPTAKMARARAASAASCAIPLMGRTLVIGRSGFLRRKDDLAGSECRALANGPQAQTRTALRAA